MVLLAFTDHRMWEFGGGLWALWALAASIHQFRASSPVRFLVSLLGFFELTRIRFVVPKLSELTEPPTTRPRRRLSCGGSTRSLPKLPVYVVPCTCCLRVFYCTCSALRGVCHSLCMLCLFPTARPFLRPLSTANCDRVVNNNC